MTALGEKEAQILISLLEKMTGYYRVILELSRAEYDKFSRDRPIVEVLPIMKRRKILHSCIEELREESRPYIEMWNKGACSDEEKNKKIRNFLAQIEEGIKESLLVSDKNQIFLEKHIEKLARDKVLFDKEIKKTKS